MPSDGCNDHNASGMIQGQYAKGHALILYQYALKCQGGIIYTIVAYKEGITIIK